MSRALKFRHFGTYELILHSYDIRKHLGVFAPLRDDELRNLFYEDLNRLFLKSRIRLFGVIIDKRRLSAKFLTPVNPYDVSVSQLLSVVCGPPRAIGVNRPIVRRIVAESRGKVEDKQLQSEYQGFRATGLASYGADGVRMRRASTVRRLYPDRIDFVRKKLAVAGLELADLAAYPLARAAVNRNWDNPAAQVMLNKLSSLVEFP